MHCTTFPYEYRLMHDNDPKHVSISTRAIMREHGIHHWPAPPESPDMNPIENLWANLKHYIRKHKKPRNQEQLKQGILEYWSTVTPDMCNRYIDHLYKVVPAVIKASGHASGY